MSWFVPGRLEVLGKHTDYAGGRSILAAVDYGITAKILEDQPGVIGPGELIAESSHIPGLIHLSAGKTPNLPSGHWGWYIQSALDRLTLNFGDLDPAHLKISSDLPAASGMSSSSALITATALALIDANQIRSTQRWKDNIEDDLDLAAYAATIENGLQFKNLEGTKGVGTFGGSEDHTAMLNCRAGELTEFSFCPTRRGASVPLPQEWSFVVAVSGVLAEKTGSARDLYNSCSERVRELTEVWNKNTGQNHGFLADALRCDPRGVEMLRNWVGKDRALQTRLDAFVVESEELIPAAMSALEDGDIATFGQIANQSHTNARDRLGNQVRETDALQELALSQGAVGSSSFGAGFGGSVWALVPTHKALDFEQAWLQSYLNAFPARKGLAITLRARPSAAARRV